MAKDPNLARDRLWPMLIASACVHLFLTPLPALLGIIAMLPALKVYDDAEIVEVELTSLPVAPDAAEPHRPEQHDEEPKEEEEKLPTPEAEPEPPKPAAPEPDAVEPPKPHPAPAADPPAQKMAPNELYADPMSLAGNAASVADPNANVRLFVFGDVIRGQPLGARIGQLLRRTPQWSDFFGPADIDPIRDVDRVLIAGPQLRNSSQVVAVVQHHLPKARIDAAFEHLVARDGAWIDRDARMARAHADRAARIFAAPNDSVVVVAPPQLEDQLRKLGEKTQFPKSSGDIALTAYIVTPYRVAKGTGIRLPESIEWARIDLRPSPDGGGVLKILAQDQDQEQATEHAQLLQALIDQVATVDLRRGGGLGAFASMLLGSEKVRLLSEARFVAKKNQIEGTIVATKAQLLNLMDLLDALLPPATPSPAQTGQAAPDGAPGTVPGQTDAEASNGTALDDSADDSARMEGAKGAASSSSSSGGSQADGASRPEPPDDTSKATDKTTESQLPTAD